MKRQLVVQGRGWKTPERALKVAREQLKLLGFNVPDSDLIPRTWESGNSRGWEVVAMVDEK